MTEDESCWKCDLWDLGGTPRTCQTGHVHYPAGGEIYTPSDYDTPVWEKP